MLRFYSPHQAQSQKYELRHDLVNISWLWLRLLQSIKMTRVFLLFARNRIIRCWNNCTCWQTILAGVMYFTWNWNLSQKTILTSPNLHIFLARWGQKEAKTIGMLKRPSRWSSVRLKLFRLLIMELTICSWCFRFDKEKQAVFFCDGHPTEALAFWG